MPIGRREVRVRMSISDKGNCRLRCNSTYILAIVVTLAFLQVTGCFSYYVYRYEPSRLDLEGWQIEVSSRFYENNVVVRTRPAVRGQDSVNTEWDVYLDARNYGAEHPTTTIFVDSIAVFRGPGDRGAVVANPSWSHRTYADKRRVDYSFGPFAVPDPISQDVTIAMFVRLVDTQTGVLLKESLFRLSGVLTKERSMWTGK